VRPGLSVRFFRTTELATALIEARNELSFLRLKAQLAKLDLLVLDELGYVPASKVGAELLFDVISTAYERTSLLTTAPPFSNRCSLLDFRNASSGKSRRRSLYILTARSRVSWSYFLGAGMAPVSL